MTLNEAEKYLSIMEENRDRQEKYNQRAYNDARNLSALVYLAKFGNSTIAKKALKTIQEI